MNRASIGRWGLAAVALHAVILGSARHHVAVAEQGAARSTIRGRVKIVGKIPGNVVIRMGADPMCAKINAGQRVVQNAVASTIEGHLANVFVVVEGTFPQVPPSAPVVPVVIDQRACVYTPRVIGVRVGQPVEVRNSDDLFHNIHTSSARGNEVNVSQPKVGMTNQFRFKEERMLRLRCDVHGWMTSWIGVVNHPVLCGHWRRWHVRDPGCARRRENDRDLARATGDCEKERPGEDWSAGDRRFRAPRR